MTVMADLVNDERSIGTKGADRTSDREEGTAMNRVSIWAQLEAKPGKEKEVEEFLKSAQPLAERERETISWYAIKMGPGKYGIFDTFADENGRNAHLNGEIAKALFAKAKDLLAKPPEISQPEILAVKS
jgi:quinol monooxygenase YgiN